MTQQPPAMIEEPMGAPGPEQGGGPPLALPWTLVVDGEDGWSADLEHGAALPRIGDRVDFIADDGKQLVYRVVEVIHTVQSAATGRPAVRAGQFTPNSTVDGADGRPPGEIRAGLPRVIVARES